VDVVALLTTVNSHFQRVAMHGTRRELLQAQANAARLPLWEIPLPWPCSNDVYEQAMSAACTSALQKGVSAIAFGDLFLEDVRRYREDRLRGSGLEPMFPLWGCNTRDLIAEMLDAGLRARVVCADPSKFPADFIGRDLDREVLSLLPAGVDPCGENGEFHTFAYAGPMFHEPIPIQGGECVTRDSFTYADVLLKDVLPESETAAVLPAESRA
jgi:diphthamide synthase (EF-2-diphthine--ammonia ligase)